MLESEIGTSAEMPRLTTFVPDYSTTIVNWLSSRLRVFGGLFNAAASCAQTA
jgi:hypothetical protein